MASSHRVRWKGRTEGPFTRDEIKARLASGDFSRLHRVEVSGSWIGLGEFIAGDEQAAPPPDGTREAPASNRSEPPAREKEKHSVHAPVSGMRKTLSPADTAFLCNTAYFLCGLAFVIPVAATIPAVSQSFRIRRHGDRATAKILIALASALTVLGFGFWYAVYTAYVRGLI